MLEWYKYVGVVNKISFCQSVNSFVTLFTTVLETFSLENSNSSLVLVSTEN